MAIRWKVCGVRDAETARVAVEAGADAIGFVFYAPSPRNVTPELAAAVASELPEPIWRFGVFVDAPAERIDAIVETAGLDFVQLAGDEPPSRSRELSRHAFKVLRLGSGCTEPEAGRRAALYPECTLLVDASVDGHYGGTGHAANWSAAAALAKQHRLMLAGGLTAENVGAAVRAVRPWAVDVSSGVESAPGVKDADRIRQFGRALEQFR